MKTEPPSSFDDLPLTEEHTAEGGSRPTSKELGDDTLQQELMRDLGECLSRLGKFWQTPQLGSDATTSGSEANTIIGSGRFDRYELIELVGQGGFGLVFRARDPLLGRVVALKVPRPEVLMAPSVKGRFLREARAAAALDHPNIVPVHETGQIGPLCYIASAFCEGTTLSAWLKENPLPNVRQGARIVRTLAAALQHAHERGILHRDLKPSNILLQGNPAAPDLDQFIPKISDFGLAKIAQDDSDMTRTDIPIGSPPYMAPEQAIGRLDMVGPESDVYALGATFYHMLVGRPPFLGQSRTDLLRQIVENDPVSTRLLRPGLPRDLETICSKCLDKDPHRRYASAAALADELNRFLQGEPILARPATIGERGRKWARRHPLKTATIVLAGLTLLSVIGVVAWRDTLIRRHAAELEREVSRANQLARDAETQSRLATRHASAAGLREASRALADRKPELAQEILHEIHVSPLDGDQRDFGWHYLWEQANREVSLLWGQDAAVIGIELAPDGKTLASHDIRGNVFLWDLSSHPISQRQCIKLATEFHNPSEAKFSHDGRFIRLIYRPPLNEAPTAFGCQVFDVNTRQPVTENSPFLGVVTERHDNHRGIGEPPGAETQSRLSRPFQWTIGKSETEPRLAPDGSILATLEQGRVTLRETNSGHILRQMNLDKPPRAPLKKPFVRFSDDGHLIGICDGNRIILWETATGREVDRFNSESLVMAFVISPSRRRLATLDATGNISVHHRETRVRHSFATDRMDPESRDHCLSFSPDETTLAMNYQPGDHSVYAPSVWEIATGRRLARFPGRPVECWIQFFPDGKSLLVYGGRYPEIWKLEPSPPSEELPPLGDEVWAVAISPDGEQLAVGTNDTSRSETLTLWDSRTCRSCAAWKPHSATVSALAYSPDGKLLASASLDTQGPNVVVWNPSDRTRRWSFEGHTHKVRSVAFSPDGQLLATASDDCTVRLWDLTSGQPRATLTGHTDKVTQAVFSPDGKYVASSSLDASVQIWEVTTGQPHYRFLADKSVRSLAFSPDGRLLATASESGMIDIWDAETGKKTARTIPTESNELRGLIFSPDGRLLAAGVDNLVKIWDMLSGQEILSLEGHRARVNALAFARDSRFLVTADHAGAVKFWRAESRR